MKPEFGLWSKTLAKIAKNSTLNKAEKTSLMVISKQLKKLKAIVEVESEEKNA